MRLIDADALTMEVECSKHNNPHTNGRVRINHINEHDHFVRMIFDAPTVDAVPVVHGRWEDAGFGLVYKCSECGHSEDVRLSNYCPKCGAKMDGGAEDGK